MGGSDSKSTSASRKPRSGERGAGTRDSCPRKFKTIITSPARGLVPGAWLDVILDRNSAPSRVVLIDLASSAVVGSLTGIPNLDVLIRCLEAGVAYRGYVESVAGGRVDVTVIQQ